MDINNDLQQINTFVKGMNTDVSDALMDSSQYRYAENVRLTTDTEENTGELRLIEGTDIYANLSDFGNIIAMTSIRDLLVVITKKQQSYISAEIQNEQVTQTEKQAVINYILVKDASDPSSNWKKLFESDIKDKCFSDNISLVTRWESDTNVKLYMADGNNPLMYINLKGGAIKGLENILSVVDTILMPATSYVYSDSGNLKGVRFQYSYRLYKMGGSATTIAPLSNTITIYQEDGGVDTSDSYINKSISVTIPQVNADQYEYMQVFRIAYVKNGEDPIVDVIYDGKIIESAIIDSGQSIDSIDYSEFLDMDTFVIYPKVIESKEDYLFAANIDDNKQNVDEGFEDLDFRSRSTGDYLSENDYNVQFLSDNILNYNEEYWHISDTDSRIGGSCKYLTWTPIKKYIYVDEKNRKYVNVSDISSGKFTQEQQNSLRPGEIYRYGIVLYDRSGQRSSVKWIADIMVGNGDEIPEYETTTNDGLNVYKFPIYGINFSIDWQQLLQDCNNKCTQVEIVRCARTSSDKITIAQGAAGYPLQMYNIQGQTTDDISVTKQSKLCSPGLLTTNKIAVDCHREESGAVFTNYNDIKFAQSDTDYLMFASPDYVYNKSEVQNALNKNQNITIHFDYSLRSAIDSIAEIPAGYPNYHRIHTKDSNFNYGVPYKIIDSPNTARDFVIQLIQNNFDPGNTDYTLYWDAYDIEYIDFIVNSYNVRLFANLNQKDDYVKVFSSYPQINTSKLNIYGTDNTVSAVAYASAPKRKHYSIFEGDQGIIDDDISLFSYGNAGGTQYLNWSLPLAKFNSGEYDKSLFTEQPNWHRHSGYHGGDLYFYPISSSGECIIIKQKNTTSFSNSSGLIQLPVLSLKNSNNTPYGGMFSIDTSVYQSYGNILQKDNQQISIYDGDCHPGIFIYNQSHTWQEEGCKYGVGQCNVYMIPLYSDIDLSATFGSLYPNITTTYKYQLQDYSGQVSDDYNQSLDAYLYNSTYSDDTSARKYYAIEYTSLDNSKYDTRVFHSNLKRNNEHVDNWLQFQELNYIDVDSRFGQITNMRLFKDKLLFWQEHAAGILSVNERTVLNDLDDNNIVVGTGGTLQRYDYISTVYGMKINQYDAETQSNYTQYWWDGYNKEILAYTGGVELVPLAKTKGITNYINKGEESIHPMLAYDIKYDEILAQVVSTNGNKETVVYNEQIQNFSSVYTYMPLYKAGIKNCLYVSSKNNIYIQNKQSSENHATLFGTPIFPKVRIVINKNNIYTKTFDNLTFGGRIYKGSLQTIANWQMERVPGEYVKDEHLNSPMHHLTFTFETPLKQKSAIRGDKSTSVDEYDYRLAIPRNGSQDSNIEYGNRMRGKTMQCEIASDYNSTDFSLQYITTKFRMSWS